MILLKCLSVSTSVYCIIFVSSLGYDWEASRNKADRDHKCDILLKQCLNVAHSLI